MANIKISFINSSTVRQDSDVKSLTSVLQDQVRNDFAPVWGVDADLVFVPKGQTADPSSWWLAVLDDADQAGALGYHDLTDTGLPLGKVFAGTDDQYGMHYSVTSSHELLEMLADPDINLTAFVPEQSGQSGRMYAYEACDACQADDNAYAGSDGKTLVSDFVYPSWFESFWKQGATQFDRQKRISAPFQLLPGGYIGYFDVNTGSGWQQLTVDKLEKKAKSWAHHQPAPGSRRYRRRLPRHQWIRSQTT